MGCREFTFEAKPVEGVSPSLGCVHTTMLQLVVHAQRFALSCELQS